MFLAHRLLRADKAVRAPLVAALALGCASVVAAGDGEPEQIAAALARQALTNSGAMEIVADLTTEIGPRLAGSEAEKRAAAWAQQRLEQLGFDKVWIETFPLDLPQRPKRSIRVVLFGAEEFGLLGGKAYAEAHQAELANYVVVAEADFGQGPVYQFQTGVANPDEPSLQRIRAALTPLGIVPGDNQSRGTSDVRPLAEARVPAVTLKLGGTDYFDLHHTADDTLDKITPDRINQSTAAYAVLAYLAAELDGDYRAPAPVPAK